MTKRTDPVTDEERAERWPFTMFLQDRESPQFAMLQRMGVDTHPVKKDHETLGRLTGLGVAILKLQGTEGDPQPAAHATEAIYRALVKAMRPLMAGQDDAYLRGYAYGLALGISIYTGKSLDDVREEGFRRWYAK